MMHRLSLFLATLMVCVGCTKPDQDPIFSFHDGLADFAGVAFFNAVPGSTGMQLSVDNQTLNGTGQSVAFGEYLPHKNVYAGNKNLLLVLTTKRGRESSSFNLKLQEKTFYSIFMYQDDKIEMLQTEDAMVSPETGFVKIRFVNLSPDAGQLRLQEYDPSSSLFQTQPLFDNIAYKTVTPFQNVKVGALHALRLTQSRSNSTSALLEETIKVQDRAFYTVLVSGKINATTAEEKISLKIIRFVP